MQSIVIPPISFMKTKLVDEQNSHLLLSHLLGDCDYWEFYQERRRQGDYLILDNSAHEMGRGQPIAVLMDQARQLQIQELVLPDVLFDGPGTVKSTQEAMLAIVSMGEAINDTYTPRSWMIVPQGKNFAEWEECLTEMLESWRHYRNRRSNIFKHLVIGLSKDYSETSIGIYPYLDTVLKWSEGGGHQVHLLGWPKPLWSMRGIAQVYGRRIRSTDSGRPFTYAFSGITLDPSRDCPKYPGRQEGFFHAPMSKEALEIASDNVFVYRQLVAGRM